MDILGESGEVILALNWSNFRGCLLVDLFVLQVGEWLIRRPTEHCLQVGDFETDRLGCFKCYSPYVW